MTIPKITALCLGLAFTAGAAMADCTSTSQWGAEDTLGSANLVTPERTLEAAKLAAEEAFQKIDGGQNGTHS